MNLNIQTSLDRFNATLGDYAFLAKKLPEEVLAKQGTKLGFELASRLALLKPGKGEITAEVMAGLKSGRGVKVRPGLRRKLQDRLGLANRITDKGKRRPQSVYGKSMRTEFVRKGKRMNFQAMAVKAETSARESGKGYSARVARITGMDQFAAAAGNTKSVFNRGRYNQLLASASLSADMDGASLLIRYGSSSTDAGTAISTPQAEQAMVEALDATTDDILVYVNRKLQEGKL